MKLERHGLSIGIARTGQEFFLDLKAVGTLTHEDYQTINPLIDSALDAIKEQQVKVLFDASELEGIELRAAWDDFKLGLKHGNEFDKIAVYGNQKWLEVSTRIGSWFVSGEVKFFDNLGDAFSWLKTD